MTLFINCRSSGCKKTLKAAVEIGYSLTDLLHRNGWSKSPDGVGYFCDDHGVQTTRNTFSREVAHDHIHP